MSRTSLDAAARWNGSGGWAALADVRVPLANDIEIWWEPEANDETRIWKAVAGQMVIDGKIQRPARAEDTGEAGGDPGIRRRGAEGRLGPAVECHMRQRRRQKAGAVPGPGGRLCAHVP